MAELLLELFSEEIPARMQKRAGEDLKKAVLDLLATNGLAHTHAAAYTTPRRLCLHVTGVPAATADSREERRGPRVDAPEKALEGFLRGAGLTKDQLEQRDEKKGSFYYAIIEKPGQATATVLAAALPDIIRHFPWPKSQRWGAASRTAGSLKWVRPLHSILAIFDGAALDTEIDGIKAGDRTEGHRFMAPGAFTVTDFADYKARLSAAYVMLDPADRAQLIGEKARALAAEHDLTLVEDAGLLAEVAGLVEWPVPLLASFDPDFLKVPEEVLQLTMKKDQKYFALRDSSSGRMAPNFITVSNIEASDGGAAIAAGNQKVIAARLADARFFWEQDLKGLTQGKKVLDDLLVNLSDIVFHASLGTVAERVGRIKALSRALAEHIPGCDADAAERAATLAKADLTSNMVYEFPEVQGVMGRYYALEQGENPAVADAVRDHYAPKGPDDTCPSAPVSVAVALAEKLDTLVGFFAIDEKPTGSKDPFALRRAALGVIRLITENDLRLNLKTLTEYHVLMIPDHQSDQGVVASELLAFFADRLKVQQREKGVRHDLIDTVFALGGEDDLVRLLARVSALQAFIGTDDGENLHAAFKRAHNILAKAGQDDFGSPSADLLVEEAEKALYVATNEGTALVEKALKAEDFTAAMAALAALRTPIDQFFDQVMVNAEDAAQRSNRFAILAAFTGAVNKVADFSRIEG